MNLEYWENHTRFQFRHWCCLCFEARFRLLSPRHLSRRFLLRRFSDCLAGRVLLGDGRNFRFRKIHTRCRFLLQKQPWIIKLVFFCSLAKCYKRAGFQCLGIYSISIYLLGSRVLEELGPEGVLNLFKMAVIASECRGGVAPFSIGCSTRSRVLPDNCCPNSWLHDCCSARWCCKWRCISRFTDAINPLSSSVALKKQTQKL